MRRQLASRDDSSLQGAACASLCDRGAIGRSGFGISGMGGVASARAKLAQRYSDLRQLLRPRSRTSGDFSSRALPSSISSSKRTSWPIRVIRQIIPSGATSARTNFSRRSTLLQASAELQWPASRTESTPTIRTTFARGTALASLKHRVLAPLLDAK